MSPGLLAQLLVCAALIAGAGFALTQSADRIAQIHGLSGGFVGLALLATVTSLPELASGLSAVILVDAPNLAVGNALGACVTTLALLVLVDVLLPHRPLYREASSGHLLTLGFGVVMLGLVGLGMLHAPHAPSVLSIGITTPVLIALYFFALHAVYRHQPAEAVASSAGMDPRREWRQLGASATVVLLAGAWLPEIGDQIAEQMGLRRSAVGTILLSLVTTLPEAVVTLSALRLGALDLAVGNLLGSCLFNVGIIAVDDLAYRRGPILAAIDPSHAGTALAALIMSGLVIVGLTLRPFARPVRIASWISLGLAAIYVINAMVIFLTQAD